MSLARLLPFFTVVLLASACAVAPERYEPVPDLIKFEQNVSSYVVEDAAVMSDELHRRSARVFLDGRFAPWRRDEPAHGTEDAFWGLRFAESKRLFGENKLPLGAEWTAEMRRLSAPESFPGSGLTAVAAVNTSMRVLPTNKPAFYDFAQAGEGFPFDMMQNTAVLAGTPLYLTHVSADRAWYLAECRYAFGWIPVREVALVARPAAEALAAGPFVTPVKDRIPLHDFEGRYLFDLRVGQILPAAAETETGHVVFAPVRGADGMLRLVEAEISDECAKPWPLPPTRKTIAGLADEMIGQKYGWGGLYGNRDCSSTLLDLFAAVGVPLPRNSRIQAKAGKRIDLSGMTPDEKRRLVLEAGAPLATLLARPGHIMLYIGESGGEPMIFHTAWGLKTEDFRGREGRRIIGKTAVTSLSPGEGVSGLARPEGVLLHKLSSMTFIGPETVAKSAPDDAMVQ